RWLRLRAFPWIHSNGKRQALQPLPQAQQTLRRGRQHGQLLRQRLRTAEGERLVRRCPLLRLARLPWLRHGFMPDWLRLSLIQAQEPAQQSAVRAALTDLLLAAVEGGEVDGAALRVATTHGQRLPRLLPPLLERLQRRAAPTSPLRDQLFLRFLQQRPLLAADAPESLRSLLRERPAAATAPAGAAAGAAGAVHGWWPPATPPPPPSPPPLAALTSGGWRPAAGA
ncbi:MAG: hypothetical protein ACKOPS_09395, partial [Cyanobium sp.]